MGNFRAPVPVSLIAVMSDRTGWPLQSRGYRSRFGTAFRGAVGQEGIRPLTQSFAHSTEAEQWNIS
jgi:hypothetical protein